MASRGWNSPSAHSRISWALDPSSSRPAAVARVLVPERGHRRRALKRGGPAGGCSRAPGTAFRRTLEGVMDVPRVTPQAFRRLTAGVLVASIAIVVTGAAVRLTGSGLGCPTWPNCRGGQLDSTGLGLKGAIEFGNRIITVAITVLVGLTALASFLLRRARRRPAPARVRAGARHLRRRGDRRHHRADPPQPGLGRGPLPVQHGAGRGGALAVPPAGPAGLGRPTAAPAGRPERLHARARRGARCSRRVRAVRRHAHHRQRPARGRRPRHALHIAARSTGSPPCTPTPRCC